MHTEKTLFELQSEVESVGNVTEAIKDLKLLADNSLRAFNVPPQKFSRIAVVTDSYHFHFDTVAGSVVFEQWVVSHLKPALQHLCEMSINEVHQLKHTLHNLTRPENDSSASEAEILPGVAPGMA